MNIFWYLTKQIIVENSSNKSTSCTGRNNTQKSHVKQMLTFNISLTMVYIIPWMVLKFEALPESHKSLTDLLKYTFLNESPITLCYRRLLFSCYSVLLSLPWLWNKFKIWCHTFPELCCLMSFYIVRSGRKSNERSKKNMLAHPLVPFKHKWMGSNFRLKYYAIF